MLWTSVEFGSDHLQSLGMSRFCVVLGMGWKCAQVIFREVCNSEGLSQLPSAPLAQQERCLGVAMPHLWCSFESPTSAAGGCSQARSPVQASQAVLTHQHHCRDSDGRCEGTTSIPP